MSLRYVVERRAPGLAPRTPAVRGGSSIQLTVFAAIRRLSGGRYPGPHGLRAAWVTLRMYKGLIVMRTFMLAPSLALVSALIAAPAAAAPKKDRCSSSFAVTDVRVFDGTKMIPKATVVVVDDEIAAVGPEVVVPPGTPTIDGAGRTLLPGLLDSHAHAWQREELERAAQFGVTTEFDMWSDPAFISAMTSEQDHDGATDRADVYSAINPATVTEGYPYNWTADIVESPTIDSPAGAKSFIKKLIKAGANHLKIMLEDGTLTGPAIPVLDDPTIVALTTEARKRGMLSMAHVTRQATALSAVSSGVDGLVHVFIDALASDEFLDLAESRGIFVVGTLAAEESFITTAGGEAIIADPDLGPYLTELEIEYLMYPPIPSVLTLDNLQIAKDNVLALHEAGVPILAGTDVATHGVSLHRDLELLVDAGLTPIDALAAATSAAADVFGFDDRGRIAPGLRADLVLVHGNPGADIKATRAIDRVWKLGVEVERPLP